MQICNIVAGNLTWSLTETKRSTGCESKAKKFSEHVLVKVIRKTRGFSSVRKRTWFE